MGSQSGSTGSLVSMIVMFAIMFGLMYILLIRPQRKKEIERLNMLKNIQKNDPVITSGGIYGIVQQVKDTEVIIKIDESNNTKIRVAKSAIIGVDKNMMASEEKR
ncbi:MAG: preprotein translocase subunit YajC [Candidatus Brocadiia bacterium]